MRKVLAVAVLVVFIVGATGLLTLAVNIDQSQVVKIYENPGEVDAGSYDGLEDEDLEGVDKAIIVTPVAFQEDVLPDEVDFEDKEYNVKAEGTDKILVAVDPIHVTK